MLIGFYSLITIFSFFMVLSLGFYVYSKDVKSKVHILFTVISVFTAFNLFAEFELMTSSSITEASSWLKPIVFVWPILFAIQIHFLIVYTGHFKNNYSKLLVFLYLFAFVTSYFTRYKVPSDIVFNRNIWVSNPVVIQDVLANVVIIAYSTFANVFMGYLAISFYRKTKSKLIKKQALLIFIGILLPALIVYFKNGPLPVAGIILTFPESIITFFGWLFLAFAIWKLNIFDITTDTVSDRIIETIKDGLLLVESSGIVVTANSAFYNIFKKTSENVIQKDISKVLHNLTFDGENNLNSLFKNEINSELCILKLEEGIPLYISVTSSFLFDEAKNVVGSVLVLSDVTLVYSAREEIDKKQKQMTEMAHHAGMAMMAADVMHNIGNIMNSINVSAEKIMSTVKTTKIKDLKKANLLFNKNRDRLPDYFATDPNANLLPEYYSKVTSNIEKEFEIIKNEGQVLMDKNKLIKDSINIQMDVVGARNFCEKVMIGTLVDEVIAIQDGRIKKFKIDVEKEFEIPFETTVEIYKSKLLNVLLNVFQNALQAVFQNKPDNRKVNLLVKEGDNGSIQIEIKDNGIGIRRNY